MRTSTWRAANRFSASRRPPPQWQAILKFGVPKGSTVVCVLTGNGLKDPIRGVNQSESDACLMPRYKALLSELS